MFLQVQLYIKKSFDDNLFVSNTRDLDALPVFITLMSFSRLLHYINMRNPTSQHTLK